MFCFLVGKKSSACGQAHRFSHRNALNDTPVIA